MLLYYIRHGDPIYQPDSLTELGKRQAEALGKRLSLHGVDEIYCSTSQRAKETAMPTSELLKMEIVELDWCNEGYAWSEFTVENSSGRNWCFFDNETRKLFNSLKIRMLGDQWYEAAEFRDTKYKKGMKRINTEVDSFLEGLGYSHIRNEKLYLPKKPNDKKIALFAHQGFGMAFLSSVLDIPYPEFSLRFDMTHSSVTVIKFDECDGIVIPKVITLSNDSHIYKEGLPTKFNNMFYY